MERYKSIKAVHVWLNDHLRVDRLRAYNRYFQTFQFDLFMEAFDTYVKFSFRILKFEESRNFLTIN